ncbi:MAG: crossover junction endodeoxyribonuclease RuvC, partial [Patescibacteria group bacterium]
MVDSKKILGIDPGLGRTGWGVIEARGLDLTPIAFGCLTTPANTPLGARLLELEGDIVALLERQQPDVVAIEQLLFT